MPSQPPSIHTADGTAPPRWGWRRAATEASRAGWRSNRKRNHRRWRDQGLRVPYRKGKKPLRGIGVAVGAMCPIRRILLEAWRIDYNMNRPHSAHDGLSPTEFVQAWLNQQQLQHA